MLLAPAQTITQNHANPVSADGGVRRAVQKMASVFIDQCIISDGDILTGERRNGVIGYVRKEPPKENWKREQFEYLPTISELAETGKIELFRYLELDFEDWKK